MAPTPDLNSNQSFDDEVSEAEMTPDKRKIESLDESPISFRLSGPNKRLGRFDLCNEEQVSSGDSVVHSLCIKPRRWLTCKEKGKKKMTKYDTDRRKSDSKKSYDGPSTSKFSSAKKALTSANEHLC